MSVRVLHVGAGTRGRHWLEIVRDYPDATSVGCVDPDARALDQARPILGSTPAPSFDDLGAALGAVQADAALIASPSTFHAEQAIRCLEAGLHVMVEKPFAPSVSDARRVLRAAEQARRHVVVAENYRFFRAERTVRGLIAAGRVGAIRTVTCVDRRRQPPSDLGPFAAALPFPQLSEIAVHHFDSFRGFFDRRPISVTARTFNPAGSPYRGGAATEALIELDGGLSIQYTGSLTSHRYEFALWIEGEHGSLWTDHKRVWIRLKGARFFRPVSLVAVPKGDEQRYPRAGTTSLLNSLRDAVRHGKEAETSGRDNLWTVAMVEAAFRSDREGRRIAITDVLAAPGASAPAVGTRARGEGGRVLVIGLDAADARLVDTWCREGHLPVLKSLREQGAWAELGTPADTLHVSGWPSFYTGVTPDKHGLYHAYTMRPGVQFPQRPRPDESPEPFFWKRLSDAGRRCVIMDAFMNGPLERFNGTQILEYGTWTWFWDPETVPSELQRELLAKFGPYPAEDHSKVLSPPDCAGFRDRLVQGARKKAEVVRWLMQREPWDFFFVMFGESHPAGHYFWHLHDASHPAHLREDPGPLAYALRDVYVAIDHAIGEILAAADERTTVVIVSADGMGPNYSGSHILEEALKQVGLFSTAEAHAESAGRSAKPARRSLVKRVRDLVPSRVRLAISRHLLSHSMKERLTLHWMTADIEWPRTRAFPIPNANEGYVRVNLKGREPEGTVAPGQEYDALCDSLVATLRGLVNPLNGRAAVRAVRRTDALYGGPCRDRLPDVIVNWDPAAKLTTQLSGPACGLIKTGKPSWELNPYYTGNHDPAAFLIARGPGIASGRVLEGVHLLDLAPTILAHYGVATPPSMDGRVLSSLLSATVR